MTQDEEQRFRFAINVLLEHEGGYSDDKDDLGGKTYFGITQKFANDHDLLIDVKDLTKEQAIDIYRKYYWDKYQYNLLSEIHVATKIFDAAVNCGPVRAARFLQISCNNLLSYPLLIDGIIGQKTISAANSIDPHKLLADLRDVMRQYYMNIVKNNPVQKKFLAGWLSRAAW